MTEQKKPHAELIEGDIGDGTTHINIYSKGETEIGRWSSNFALSPFTHPKHGKFKSVEGLWYYLQTGKEHEELRNLYGYQAKKVGRQIRDQNIWDDISKTDEFKDDIIEGIRQKFREHPRMLRELCKTDGLPLEHYYTKNNTKKDGTKQLVKINSNAEHHWVIQAVADIREISVNYLKEKRKKSQNSPSPSP